MFLAVRPSNFEYQELFRNMAIAFARFAYVSLAYGITIFQSDNVKNVVPLFLLGKFTTRTLREASLHIFAEKYFFAHLRVRSVTSGCDIARYFHETWKNIAEYHEDSPYFSMYQKKIIDFFIKSMEQVKYQNIYLCVRASSISRHNYT